MTTENAQSEVCSAEEVAAKLSISMSTLLRRVKQKKVPAPLPRTKPGSGRGKRGGPLQWRKSDIDSYLRLSSEPAGALNHQMKTELKELMREVIREEGLA